jgi:hypothetical protein
VFFRVLKKYLRQGELRDVDILVVTERFGIVSSEEPVPYNPDFFTNVDPNAIAKLRRRNLAELQDWFSKRKYSEIYVNCGRDFMPLIEGFEKLTSAKITIAKGSGIGPKAANMKAWILSQR